jgi:tetratricopeptide (TPR) repeat protein
MTLARLLTAVVLFNGCAIVVTQDARNANDACAQFIAIGDLPSADAACDLALQYQPRYWDALHNKGLVAKFRGELKTAKQFFIEAVRANPDMRQLYNALGAMAAEAGDTKTAIEFYESALRTDPRYLEARRNVGSIHLRRKDFAAAEKSFRQLILVQHDVVEGWLGLAASFSGQGKLDEAAQALEKATMLNVSDPLPWWMRGENALDRGELEEAHEFFERCLLADAKDLRCQRRLAELDRSR